MREASQIATFVIHLFVILGVVYSYIKRPDKVEKYIPQFLFGLSGALFYFWLLFTDQDLTILSETRTDISSMRSLFQATLIATSIWQYRFDDITAFLRKRWNK